MKKIALLFVAIFATFTFTQAQTLEELKSAKAEKEGVKAGIDAEIAALEKQIREFPGWTSGVGVLFGLDFAGQNRWYAVETPFTGTSNFGIGLNAFANLNEDKYYVKTDAAANWARGNSRILDAAGDVLEETPISVGTFAAQARPGFYIYEDLIAVSGRLGWNTVLFDFSPGQITASAGASITPMKDLEIWVHPLGYQLNYPGDDFTSVAGASFGGSYVGNLYKNIKWTSTLEGFFAYGGDEANGLEASDLHNWTWRNGFVIDNVFKGIGVGLTYDIRQNRQLAKVAGVDKADWGQLQTLYNLGFSYTIAR